MSRRVLVLTDCDFEHAGQEVEGTEVVMTVGEGKSPKALGACAACWAKYVEPLQAAYEACDAKPGAVAPAEKPKATRTGTPSPGPCPDCGKETKNLTGWVQHLMRAHDWDQDKRDAYLAEYREQHAA